MAGQHVQPKQIDDEWRRWIAENLLLDRTPESILSTMVENGFVQEIAVPEINAALASPYLVGANILCNRLRKREWQLRMYRKGERMHSKAGEVPRRHKLSRQEFIDEFYSANRPVIITGMMEDWPAMKKWNLDFFEENFGGRVVEVQTGRKDEDNYEINREKYLAKMPFSEFVEKIRTAGKTNDFYITANNSSYNKEALRELWDDIVQIPEYLDPKNPAGFLWFGPAGTITPFHHDLTNNFMAQVIGRKRVLVVPSWDMPLMQNHYHVYSTVDGRKTPHAPAPAFEEPQIIECILNAGEVLFLPIGWMHFVEGLDMSVTISFTNFNVDNDFTSFYNSYHEL